MGGTVMSTELSLVVNDIEVRLDGVEPRERLSDVLRDRLRLTGVHLSCEQGICGACTVLIDGRPAKSCIVLAHQARDTQVTTIEGLAHDGSYTRCSRPSATTSVSSAGSARRG